MAFQNTVAELKTVKKNEKFVKQNERNVIHALEVLLKAKKLGQKTDLLTLPVTKVNVNKLRGVVFPGWQGLWDHKSIDPRTPIIIDRYKYVIAGAYQYYDAVENGVKEIDAIYIDSIRLKILSIHTLRKQFPDKDVCLSLAYSLYIVFYDALEYIRTYSEFCEIFESIFSSDDIYYHTMAYFNELDKDLFGCY